MRTLYHALLTTAFSFLGFLAAAALTAGTTWAFQHRALLLAASLGLGAAVASRRVWQP